MEYYERQKPKMRGVNQQIIDQIVEKIVEGNGGDSLRSLTTPNESSTEEFPEGQPSFSSEKVKEFEPKERSEVEPSIE